MSTLQVTTIQSNSTTAPPVIQNSAGAQYGTFCRAWVNFNGTGTIAINASFNVSALTDNAVGSYSISFTNAFADANYSTTAATANSGYNAMSVVAYAYTTNNVSIITTGITGATNANTDPSIVSVAVFR